MDTCYTEHVRPGMGTWARRTVADRSANLPYFSTEFPILLRVIIDEGPSRYQDEYGRTYGLRQESLKLLNKVEIELIWDEPAPTWYSPNEKPLWSYKILQPSMDVSDVSDGAASKNKRKRKKAR